MADSSTKQQDNAEVATFLDTAAFHHQKALVEFTGTDSEPVKVTGSKGLPIEIAAGFQIDAAGRLRVSNPYTLFDSKLLHDAMPRIWDDQEVSGSGTTSVHSTDTASVVLGVAAATAGKRIRQSRMRFNYHSGKSHQIKQTGVLRLTGGGTGITVDIGPHDDDNGLFFRNLAGTAQVVLRSSTSGSAVDTAINQANWNQDVLDGTGASGVTADWTKAQLFIFDFQWLGLGPVRLGVVIGNAIIYVHHFNDTANVLAVPFMSTPNLPLRYEIENDGTGAASTMRHICATVISEGGAQEIGTIRSKSTEGTALGANAAGTIYAVIGIRLKSTHLDAVVKQLAMSMLAEGNKDYEWTLALNPTVAGVFTYSGLTNSAVEVAVGVTANTVTSGTIIAGQVGSSSMAHGTDLHRAIHLGSAIDGTRDTLVLCVRPYAVNTSIHGNIGWRELV